MAGRLARPEVTDWGQVGNPQFFRDLTPSAVIRVVPHKAVLIDERPKADALDARDHRGTDLDAQLASSRQTAEQHGVRLRTVTLRGEPARVIPTYAQLHDASLLIAERDYGSSRFWRSSRVVDDVARRSPMSLLVLPRRQRRERDVPSRGASSPSSTSPSRLRSH